MDTLSKQGLRLLWFYGMQRLHRKFVQCWR